MQKNCLAPLITLRLIHLNGTITPISINYPKLDTIQGNNPCINYINNQVGYRKPLSKRDPATTSQDNITKSKNEESSPTSKSEDISAPTFVDTSAPVDTLSVEKPTSSLTTSASISSTVTVSEGEVPLIESTDLFANIAPITETSKKRSSLTTSTSTSIEPTVSSIDLATKTSQTDEPITSTSDSTSSSTPLTVLTDSTDHSITISALPITPEALISSSKLSPTSSPTSVSPTSLPSSLPSNANSSDVVSPNIQDRLKVFAVSLNFILLTHPCDLSSDSNGLCATVLNWDGRVLNSTIKLDNICTYNEVIENPNVKDLDSFLTVCYNSDNNKLFWSIYTTPDHTGSIDRKAIGVLENQVNFSSNLTNIFSTEDGGYAIITSVFNQMIQSDYLPPWSIYATFLPSISQILKDGKTITRGPYQIYLQSTGLIKSFKIYQCSISYHSYGYSCVVNMDRYDVNKQLTRSVFLRIDFLAFGSVIKVKELGISGNNDNVNNQILAGKNIWDIMPLYYGGYCLMAEDLVTKTVQGVIYSTDGDYVSDWGMPAGYTYEKTVGITTNNTIWSVSMDQSETNWKLIATDSVVNYTSVDIVTTGNPAEFGNIFINSTFPPKNSIITQSSTTPLNITYLNQVQLASGNISIYQVNDNPIDDDSLSSFINTDNSILRQTFSGSDSKYVKMIDNNTITLSVLSSTFNQPDKSYYILVENGFVKDKKTNQNLLGIKSNMWKFSTDLPNSDTTDQNSKSALIRLTPDGSSFYTTTSSANQSIFSEGISREIALMIPCHISRVSTTKLYQYDASKPNQILLRVDVQQPSNNNDISQSSITESGSDEVLRDLDVLIRNKFITPISKGLYTRYLDDEFGSPRIRFSILMIIQIFIFCLARRINKKGRNCAVFLFTLIAIDLGLDIAFLLIHGQDLLWLYPVSAIFITLPILYNIISTYFIITTETKNDAFYNWWRKHSKTGLLFTVLAGADLESLNTISSGCMSLDMLSAPLTPRTMDWICIRNDRKLKFKNGNNSIISVPYEETNDDNLSQPPTKTPKHHSSSSDKPGFFKSLFKKSSRDDKITDYIIPPKKIGSADTSRSSSLSMVNSSDGKQSHKSSRSHNSSILSFKFIFSSSGSSNNDEPIISTDEKTGQPRLVLRDPKNILPGIKKTKMRNVEDSIINVEEEAISIRSKHNSSSGVIGNTGPLFLDSSVSSSSSSLAFPSSTSAPGNLTQSLLEQEYQQQQSMLIGSGGSGEREIIGGDGSGEREADDEVLSLISSSENTSHGGSSMLSRHITSASATTTVTDESLLTRNTSLSSNVAKDEKQGHDIN
ncbi:8612_t:CDS:10 [Entrophospora sp. SA101]|nr:8612_t:CDS:10 [Entrophospora sp. SA101]